jgi:hypothetical protein
VIEWGAAPVDGGQWRQMTTAVENEETDNFTPQSLRQVAILLIHLIISLRSAVFPSIGTQESSRATFPLLGRRNISAAFVMKSTQRSGTTMPLLSVDSTES